MIVINNTCLDEVTRQAREGSRLRKNLNFHVESSDPLQRMLNAIEPGTYVCPHKHEDPDKREVFVILRGRVLVVEFSTTGDVVNYTILDPEDGVYAVEIAPRVFHAMYSLVTGSVVYEIKDGPYSPLNDKHFASWAPREGQPGCQVYLSQLLQKIQQLNPALFVRQSIPLGQHI